MQQCRPESAAIVANEFAVAIEKRHAVLDVGVEGTAERCCTIR